MAHATILKKDVGVHMKPDGWKVPLAVIGVIVGAAAFIRYQPHKSGDVAAWVQAVASVIAIWWSGYSARKLQFDSERQRRRTMASVLSEIADSVTNLTAYVQRKVPDRETLTRIATGEVRFEFGELGAMEKALRQIPLHELAAPEFVKPTLVLRSSLRQLRENLDFAFERHRQMEADEFDKLFEAIGKLSRVCSETARDIRGVVDSI
ncbi:hypothetical protein [Paraburkholderia unamae]|uniref:hypothetical protein n=1 Tax=Paraburkholderia unamae TaxID=219649 RepID=UPI0010577380|nr:hypothetical protein [Paraburkholderia unamae]